MAKFGYIFDSNFGYSKKMCFRKLLIVVNVFEDMHWITYYIDADAGLLSGLKSIFLYNLAIEG